MGGPPPSLSMIVTVTEAGLPSTTVDGSGPSNMVKVSSSVSSSSTVALMFVPVVAPAAIERPDIDP